MDTVKNEIEAILEIIRIETGTWCNKYQSWVNDRTVKVCQKDGNRNKKGCAKCIFVGEKTKVRK